MKLEEEKKESIANSLRGLMIRNDVENFAMKREIYAAHALQHGVDSKEGRTLHVSFDLIIQNEEDMP